jgi:predicted aminopeptidase
VRTGERRKTREERGFLRRVIRLHPSSFILRLHLGAAGLAVLLLSGCANFGYYLQSVQGQLEIWRLERPIEEVIRDPATAGVLRDRLAAVLRIREFATRELGLPENASYRRYADLGRPFVVWNVFATPELSLEARQWCFLFAGCVNYRGYFEKAAADRFAAALAKEGYDVHTGGVPAYSTLGWFADPVLNTFIHYPEPELARLMFHELAHQVAYAKDDTVFNESFAVAVETEGVLRWLARHGSVDDKAAFERAQQRRTGFVALVERYRERLAALYRSRVAPQAMRERKARILAELTRDYERLKSTEWGGYAGYDAWFTGRPNNASIASIALYAQKVPAFQALLRAQGNDLPRFYDAVRALAAQEKHAREEALQRMMPPRSARP